MFFGKNMILSIVLVFIKSIIILLLYMYFDKKCNKKRKHSEYVMIFILCDIYVLYNVVKELKSKDNTSSRALIVILTALLITNFSTNFVVSMYNKSDNASYSATETQTKYYDRKGVEYSSLEDVVYYTCDGAEFKHDFKNSEYVCIINTNENKYDSRYDSLFTYVDENGWIVFSENILDYDKSKGDYGFYDEKAQKYYANIDAIRWNKNGTIYWDY